MVQQSTREFGRADRIDEVLGLEGIVAQKLASIITFAGSIEYHMEKAIWSLEGIDPKGVRPATDAKPVTMLIAMLETSASGLRDDDVRGLLEIWCQAARSGYIIRHNVAHGVAFKVESTLVFSRNPRWHGEIRKREFGDLWCDTYTLDLIRESFATLLRIILTIAKDSRPLADVASPLSLRAVREARSILGEFADQFYNPGFEKY